MTGTVIFLIFIIAVSGYIYLDTKEKQDKQEESYEQYEYTNSTDTNDMTEEELKEELINQIREININLVELQNQLDKQNKKINKIQDNVGYMTFIICIPVVIGIIIALLSIYAGSNILKDLGNTTKSTSVYVTDQDGNIIKDDEYHGQNVNNSNLDTYYDTDYQNN